MHRDRPRLPISSPEGWGLPGLRAGPPPQLLLPSPACQGGAQGNVHTPAALQGLGIPQSIPAMSPSFNVLWKGGYEPVRVKVTLGMCPLADPHGNRGTCDTQWLHPKSPSTIQLSLLLQRGSWHKPPPSDAFSEPSSISRMKIQVEQAILKFFLAKKWSRSWHFCCSWYEESRS